MPYVTQQLPHYFSAATQDDEGHDAGVIVPGQGQGIQGEMRMGFIPQPGASTGEFAIIPGYIPSEDGNAYPVSCACIFHGCVP